MAEPMSQELRDLIERNSAVQEMAQGHGWELLVDYMRAQMGGKQRRVLLGNMKTLEEYCKETGWIQGVMDMINAPDDLAEQVEREQLKERDKNG